MFPESEIDTLENEVMKMKFQAHLEEFKILQDEKIAGENSMIQVILYSLILTGGAVPIVASLVERGLIVVLLAVPIIFTGLAWLYYLIASTVGDLGTYQMEVLTPEVNRIIGTLTKQAKDSQSFFPIWQWEMWIRKKRIRGSNRLQSALNLYSVFFLMQLPGLGSTALFIAIKISQSLSWNVLEITWFSLDILLIVITWLIAGMVPRVHYSRVD